MSSSNKLGLLRDDTTGALIVQGIADRDNGQAGIVAPTAPGWFANAAAVVAARGYLARVVPSRDIVVTKIGFVVTVAASVDDPVDVGIYDSTLTTLLVSSGATLGKLNAVGNSLVTVATTTLRAGTPYYAALSVGTVGGTAATIGLAGWGSTLNSRLFGATAGLTEADAKATVHPLPAAWGGISGVTPNGAMLVLRES